MNKNNKVSFVKRKGVTDEWYTPYNGVQPIIKHIQHYQDCKHKKIDDLIVWCPFDKENSEYVKQINELPYVKVIFTHIDNGQDFFLYQPLEWDIIVSNPPYSIRNKILERVFSFKKPFALLMNTNGIFDSKIRWDLFNQNSFSFLYLKGRINYMREYGKVEKSTPTFQSAYITSGLFKEKIVFDNNIEDTRKAEL